MTNTEPVKSDEKAKKLPDPINIHPADILIKKFPSAFSGSQKGEEQEEERETMFA
jgi:hypothetical protein